MSHDPSKKSFRETTAEEYQALFERVEEAFDPEEMTRDRLMDWLRNSTLADMFAVTKELYDQIEATNDVKELKELKKEARSLKVHSAILVEKADERIEEIQIEEREKLITGGTTEVIDFAETRDIELTDQIIGRVETWKDNRKRIVVREKGRLKAWRFA